VTSPQAPGTPPPITDVSGGVAGLSATYARLHALADRYDDAADRLRGWAARAGRVAADPDLVASAPLSPVTFARAEAAVLDAATGVHGLLETSVAYEADAVAVRSTVRAFEECDRLVAGAMHLVDYEVGRTLGTTLVLAGPSTLVALGCAAPVGAAVADRLPAPARRRLEGGVRTAGDLGQETLDRHPSLVQHVVDGGGGLLDGLLVGVGPVAGLTAFHPRLADAAGDVALLYGVEGPPRVRARPDLTVPLGRRAPRSVADLMRHLDQTNALSPGDRPSDAGTLEVQTLRAADGSLRHVVYLPGTDDLGTTPFSQDDDVRDLATNLRLVAGDPTTYAAGIEQAMGEAGIRPREPVLLVGHSQGGMEAAGLLAHGSGFHVTDVVTAGSPIAQVAGYPAASHVLSLENRGDVVPLLDGADNPDAPQHVTVQFDDHETSAAGNHALTHYVRGAEAVDVSADPSVREQVASLRRQGFLDGRVTASRVFQVTR
jgi:hypothetical protein